MRTNETPNHARFDASSTGSFYPSMPRSPANESSRAIETSLLLLLHYYQQDHLRAVVARRMRLLVSRAAANPKFLRRDAGGFLRNIAGNGAYSKNSRLELNERSMDAFENT